MITVFRLLACASAISLVSVATGTADAPKAGLCEEAIDFGNISDSLGTANQNINSDLVALLEQKSGCRIRTILLPVKRVVAELQDGTLHMSARFFQNEERDKYLWFAHVQRTKILAWFRHDTLTEAEAARFMTSDDVMLGITAGFTHSPTIDRLLSEWQRAHPGKTIEFPDRKALFEGLLAGRADIVLLPRPIVEEFNAILNPTNIPLSSIDLAPGEAGAPGGIVFSKRQFDAETVARWQRIVLDLCQDGSILRVFQKYFRATEEDLACSLRKY
jgi:polar amino acid transport system substrate-binding protein